MLRAFAVVLLLVSGVSYAGAAESAADGRVYELRTYFTEEGKLDELHARFREHTIRLFEKHGMTVVGFWVPTSGEASANTLVYLLSFPSAEKRAESWRAFGSDEEWKKVRDDSEKNGPLITKIESTLLAPTDYSPLR